MKSVQEIIEGLLKDRQKLFDEMSHDLRKADAEHNKKIVEDYVNKSKIIDEQIRVLRMVW